MNYRVINQGFGGTRKLYPVTDNIFDHITNPEKDWYYSIFEYNEQHKKQLEEKKSLTGIRDVITHSLVWDLDSATDLEKARLEAKELCYRLIQKGIPEDSINVAFSGGKGFSIVLETDKDFTVDEFKSINNNLAESLQTNDTTIADPQRIFRIVGTKHNKSGLYKFPITYKDLVETPIERIVYLAKNIDNADAKLAEVKKVKLPDSIYNLRLVKKEPSQPKVLVNVGDLDFTRKPKGFTSCKYAIMEGFYPPGSRDQALLILASTCKAAGYNKEVTYNICKAANRLQSTRFNQEPFSKKELWLNVIDQVYKPSWNGGQYSCKKENTWLRSFCQGLGKNKCNHVEDEFKHPDDMFLQYEDYATKIEENTIRTGIAALDENVRLTIGMPVGLLGAPSSGKTSLALNILNNTSLSGLSSVFFSMDMFGPLVFQKQIQKQFGYNDKQIYDIFRNNKSKASEIKEVIKEQYKNVKFALKAGYSVQEMRESIDDFEQKSGDKVKLVLIDYLECIAGPYSDSTANTHKIAGELRDFATDTSRCIITLVQPPKVAGDACSPLTSMRSIKGSSMLEQSFRVILGIYREGFGPKRIGYDKYITINSLKNTMGELFSVDNYWDGKTGTISPLDEEGEAGLRQLRESINKEKDLTSMGSW